MTLGPPSLPAQTVQCMIQTRSVSTTALDSLPMSKEPLHTRALQERESPWPGHKRTNCNCTPTNGPVGLSLQDSQGHLRNEWRALITRIKQSSRYIRKNQFY